MKKQTPQRLIALCLLTLVAGCAPAAQHVVTITMPVESTSAREAGTRASQRALSAPASFNGFNCFAINVTGPGISRDSRAAPFCALGSNPIGMLGGTADFSGGSVSISVPEGHSRVVQLLGIMTPDGSCPSFDQLGTYISQSGMIQTYVLGQATTDVLSDVGVSIQAQYNPAQPQLAFTGCSAAPKLTGSVLTVLGTSAIVGSVNGQTTVTLMGSGFSSASNIMIGGAACKIGTVTQSLLQCLTAPHTAGTVDIVLTNPDGQTAILPAGFTYASVTQFAATDEYMCAVYSNGALVCWGGNSTGQIGNGSTGSYAAPTMVFTSGVTEVAVSHGGHTCALMTGGSVQCWGNNGSGQLGTGSYSPSTAPSGAISGLPSTAHLYLGLDHSCAVTTGGALYCWGLNSNGACCAPTIAYNVQSSVPTAHEIYASGVSTSPYQVATGVYNTCANIGGEIRCWGGGADNQLGNSGAGDVNNTSYLTISGGGLSLSSLSGNSDDVCAMDSSGLECWGPNASGQDGNGANSAISSRTTIDSTNPITQTFMSGDHTCALTSAGNVFCWGGGVAYQLGNNATSSQNSEPSAIAGGAIKLPFGTTGITQISGGAGYSCALQNGDVFCWGSQAAGAGILGYLSPTAVSNPETSPRSSPP